jgi:hypothetical protein
MKTLAFRISAFCLLLFSFLITEVFGQSYNLVQSFEAGGTGSDGCWTGFSASATPSTNNFFTVTNQFQSGSRAGGMYACCGGAGSNAPTYYISPELPEGEHFVSAYLKQSSQFNENFEIGTVSSLSGGNWTAVFTKSTWPSPVAWERSTATLTTTATNNRIAFRVPSASTKTYFLDSLVIGNAGNSNSSCTYTLVTSNEKFVEGNQIPAPFPNPFSNDLRIENPTGEKMEFTLFDLNGKKVLNQSFTGPISFNTGGLEKGIYLYKVTGNSGSTKGKLVRF